MVINFYYEIAFCAVIVTLLYHRCATPGKFTLEIYNIILPKIVKLFDVRKKLLTKNYFYLLL